MDKENVNIHYICEYVYIHAYICIHAHKYTKEYYSAIKEGNLSICNNMMNFEVIMCQVRKGRERQIRYDFTSMWNQKNPELHHGNGKGRWLPEAMGWCMGEIGEGGQRYKLPVIR